MQKGFLLSAAHASCSSLLRLNLLILSIVKSEGNTNCACGYSSTFIFYRLCSREQETQPVLVCLWCVVKQLKVCLNKDMYILRDANSVRLGESEASSTWAIRPRPLWQQRSGTQRRGSEGVAPVSSRLSRFLTLYTWWGLGVASSYARKRGCLVLPTSHPTRTLRRKGGSGEGGRMDGRKKWRKNINIGRSKTRKGVKHWSRGHEWRKE